MEGVGDVSGVTQPTTATVDPTVTLSTGDRKRRDVETFARATNIKKGGIGAALFVWSLFC